MTKFTEAELNELLRSNPDVDLIERHSATQSAQSDDKPRLHSATPVQRERALQAAIFAEAERRAVDDARWSLLFPTVNGQYRPGQRPEPGMSHAVGIPDLCLPVARAATETHPAYHGLWCELKAGKNHPTNAQRAWLTALDKQGYYAVLVWDSVQNVIDLIEWYLSPEGP